MYDLPPALKKVVFADLVAAQDAGASVRDSRFAVAQKHNLAVDDIVRIEREGIDRQWPPLT